MIVLLLGVKTTLNKLAVKLELSWQVLRDFDSINLMAETPDRREEKESKVTTGDNVENLMIVNVCRRMPSRRDRSSCSVPGLPNACEGWSIWMVKPLSIPLNTGTRNHLDSKCFGRCCLLSWGYANDVCRFSHVL